MTEGEAQTIPNTVNSGDGNKDSQARKGTCRSLLGGQALEHTVLSRQLSGHRRTVLGDKPVKDCPTRPLSQLSYLA